mgnify:CR=1 FL=1
MSITVKVPTPLRKITNGEATVTSKGSSLLDCINNMEQDFPGIKERLCDEELELRRFVNLYVNGEDVRFLEGVKTPLKPGDEVSIVPAVAGG